MKSNRLPESVLTPIVHLLVRKGDAVLMLERTNTGYNDGYYGLIAGHKKSHEKVTDAIIREAKEEADIALQLSDIHFVHALHRLRGEDTDERIDLFFTTKTWLGEIKNVESHKHSELKFFPLDKLPDNTVPFIKSAIEHIENNHYFSEFSEI